MLRPSAPAIAAVLPMSIADSPKVAASGVTARLKATDAASPEPLSTPRTKGPKAELILAASGCVVISSVIAVIRPTDLRPETNTRAQMMIPNTCPQASPAPCQNSLEIFCGLVRVTRKAQITPMIIACEMASCLNAGTMPKLPRISRTSGISGTSAMIGLILKSSGILRSCGIT